MKKIGIILAILSVLTLSFITNNNVSAVSDYSVTLTSSTDKFLCVNYDSDVPLCSGYKYLLIETNFGVNTYSANSQIVYFLGGNNSGTSTFVSLNSPRVVLDVEGFSRIRVFSINNTSSLPSGWSVTYTLSENNPAGGITPEGSLDVSANGTYDVTNYASVDVNVDSSLPPFVDIVIDAFWKYHVAFAAAIPAILAIFFIFRFIKGRVK